MAELDRLGGRPNEDTDDLFEVFGDAPGRALRYQLSVRESRLRDELVIDLYQREARAGGQGGALKPFQIDEVTAARYPVPEDRHILQLLLGNGAEDRSRARLGAAERYSRSVVRPGLFDVVLPALCETGRFLCESAMPGVMGDPVTWDGGEPYQFELVVSEAEGTEGWKLWGRFVRDDETIDLKAPRLVLSGGLLALPDRLALHEAGEAIDWIERLRRQGPVTIPRSARDQLMVQLSSLPNLPEIVLPPELHWSQIKVEPRARVCFAPPDVEYEAKYVLGKVSFEYGGQVVYLRSNRRVVVDAKGRQLFRRDRHMERHALERLKSLGLRASTEDEIESGEVAIATKDLSQVIRTLVQEGWYIEAEGAPVRAATGALSTKVSSGIDWFDMEGELAYDEVRASLPELLLGAERGDGFVPLSDGSKGLAPDWLPKFAGLAKTGKVEGSRLRFLPSQAGIIDALLTGQDDVSTDVKFERIQKILHADVPEANDPTGFQGSLRSYQKVGVGWLLNLVDNGLCGCLADDMGLGKTVQVLAFLQSRHRPGGRKPSDAKPSIIVVPKSLIYNWIKEAKKFTPDLKAVAYTGASRLKVQDNLLDYDFIVTTYGTLRQDILKLLEVRFNTVILDEAQAIKNPRSQAAKACRLLRSDHRLAISGTPIENSLDELWSIFEFLNPGMLGPLDQFSAKHKNGGDEEWLELLSASLRPFMLRRTKEQVLKELPEKTELTMMVELDETQREEYNDLRDYYRTTLASKIGEVGLAKAKIHVLEALLRLRQAACHPGLIDKSRIDEPSAKLQMLYDKLEELTETGHKALVFSQFTELLKVVKRWLDKKGIKHEYLDGGTRDRQGGVDRFQSDPDNKVFLISLKAGGCGLTLTSSDYVFLLDPWWNPAVEAQAIDRAHRMGQKRPVFAYRLITQGTVEEKIARLQGEKRKLADAVISGDKNLMKQLTEDDLEKLFG